MGHQTLKGYYKSNFNLVHHYKWSLSDLEAMMPWEKYIYLDMLQVLIEEENRRIREEHSKMRASGRYR